MTSLYRKHLWPGLCIFGILAAGVTVILGAGGSTDSHPTLVQVTQEACTSCHEDLLLDQPVIHPPVADDCTSCHEVEKSESGTSITLMAPEPDLCIACHDGLEAAVSGDLATPHPAVMDSCLSCHNVHAGKHEKLLVEPKESLCTTCHDRAELQVIHKDQLHEAVDCTSCHLPHGGENPRMLAGKNAHVPFGEGSCNACHRKPFGPRVRLRAPGNRLCVSCHGEFEVPEGGTEHAALDEVKRRAGCLQCHDPHMSNYASLTLREGPALCSACHGTVSESATGEGGHPPASEDCLNCHQPHVADQSKLLVAPREELCQACHDIDDEDLRTRHLGANLAGLDCTTCHTPHGSESGALLAKTIHPPILDGCDTCHEDNSMHLMDNGESSLCLMCHDDIGETAEAATVPHPAMEMIRCADCHNPHASAQEKLVKAPGNGVCVACHDDKAPAGDEVAHRVIDEWGCQTCHLPHGGENRAMLRAEGDQLCRSCHDRTYVRSFQSEGIVTLLDRFQVSIERAYQMATLQLKRDGTFGHPEVTHRTAGKPSEEQFNKKGFNTIFQGELSCLTCHDPHKGRSSKLFRWNATTVSQACNQCHPR
ncbi:MAG: cytochrome c3 family protein [Acidobacteria bacterium]|uniref:Cytochrome c3 family protein n=1 Tax=Candidatus Polarisedimenticola svalbardensis TaxID=2886004 RepID=A0A8J6Y017_9BACT|nr:cytochrome c3 family protein [Candidatus Polarisedimenticola svalbardensis]